MRDWGKRGTDEIKCVCYLIFKDGKVRRIFVGFELTRFSKWGKIKKPKRKEGEISSFLTN